MRIIPILLLLAACTSDSGNHAQSVLSPFTESDGSITSCGSWVLLDGGSQQFCFQDEAGRTLTVFLSNIDDPSPLTFVVESDSSESVVVASSSRVESDLLDLMRDWLERSYSGDEILKLQMKLDRPTETLENSEELSAEEQTALLISDLPALLATREKDR